MHTKRSQQVANPSQEQLFIESFPSAVEAIAARVGGMKGLGLSIWPAKGEDAGKWLSDCLNPDRAAKLSISEIILIMRIGREAGVHTVMHWLADEVGYTHPAPITLDDRIDEATREMGRAADLLAKSLETLKLLRDQKEGSR